MVYRSLICFGKFHLTSIDHTFHQWKSLCVQTDLSRLITHCSRGFVSAYIGVSKGCHGHQLFAANLPCIPLHLSPSSKQRLVCAGFQQQATAHLQPHTPAQSNRRKNTLNNLSSSGYAINIQPRYKKECFNFSYPAQRGNSTRRGGGDLSYFSLPISEG